MWANLRKSYVIVLPQMTMNSALVQVIHAMHPTNLIYPGCGTGSPGSKCG